ncbi:transcription factor grauzone-like [Uranotaenia lowii]|uniref:transcription factor grauzone-like n=1 Tax=Uranotaenia lowii TaxID=190385 RepID=UPI00247A3CF6|nr:transcription factor grauzone-like [Uranotaenia lowii]
MEVKLDGCRLCVEDLGSPSCPLQDPDLQQQMKSVFYFPIEPKQGCSSSVCSECIFVIKEFYKFAEKVRQNQDIISIALSTYVNNCTNTVSQFKLEPLDTIVEDGKQSLEPKQEITIDNNSDVDVKFEPLDLENDQLNQPQELEGVRITNEENRSDVDDLVDIKTEPLDLENDEPNQPQDPEGFIITYYKDNCKDVVMLDNTQEPSTKHQKGTSQKPNKPKTKEQILEDEKTLNDFFQMVCDLCGQKEPTFKLLMCHFEKIHNQPGYVICCKEKLYLRSKLKLHMLNHVNPDGELCEICNKYFKKIEQHRKIKHTRDENKKFKCDQCPKAFINQFMLTSHLNRHLPKPRKTHQRVQCPQCDMTLANKDSLTAHIFHKHSIERTRMICDVCGKQFLNKPCFERHVKIHNGIDAIPKCQCHICKRVLAGEPGLKRHMKSVHAERVNTHECDVCHRQYPNTIALCSHQRKMHIIEAKFKCEFCGKLFKEDFRLQEHRAVHMNDRLWKCEYCDKAVNTKNSLWCHVKKCHPTEYAEQKRLAIEKAFSS